MKEEKKIFKVDRQSPDQIPRKLKCLDLVMNVFFEFLIHKGCELLHGGPDESFSRSVSSGDKSGFGGMSGGDENVSDSMTGEDQRVLLQVCQWSYVSCWFGGSYNEHLVVSFLLSKKNYCESVVYPFLFSVGKTLSNYTDNFDCNSAPAQLADVTGTFKSPVFVVALEAFFVRSYVLFTTVMWSHRELLYTYDTDVCCHRDVCLIHQPVFVCGHVTVR